VTDVATLSRGRSQAQPLPAQGSSGGEESGPIARGELSAEQVIDTALRLSSEHGLDGWTIRDLAHALGT
jgi:hypothetical protein